MKCLPRQLESPCDHRLGGDDRRKGRQGDKGWTKGLWHKNEKRVCGGGGLNQNQRPLTQIIQGKGRQDEEPPSEPDRRLAEMPLVCVERLGSGHGQEDARKNNKADCAVIQEKCDTEMRG